MSYLALDLETAGVNPEEHSILEIGAVIDDGRPIDQLPTFHYQVHNKEGIVGQPRSLKMAAENGILTSDLPKVRPKHLAVVLAGWLHEEDFRDTAIKREYITVAGKNAATFDIPFLKKIPHFTDLFTVRSRTLDPTTLYYRPQEDQPPTLDECLQRAGIDEEVEHTALADARQVVKLIRQANGIT